MFLCYPPFFNKTKFKNNTKKVKMTKSKFSILTRILGFLFFIFALLVFVADRIIHVVLVTKTHESFSDWFGDTKNVKFGIARIFIFSVPIIIYRLIF